MTYFFSNQIFDKSELKRLIHWFLSTYGTIKTLNMVDRLKSLGFHYATQAGISLGIEDLKIPLIKMRLLCNAEEEVQNNEMRFARGRITAVERSQKVIDIWNTTTELLKEEVIAYFRETDSLNPVYMMAFSGARGNISQVRQLVGMRGLMSDPKGEIIDLPIKSNFREGLTVTEYIISCYGARKGLVDTALKTANSGYLTRRLVDVAQAVIINELDCNTSEGIIMEDLFDGNKVLISREKRLVGRVLARLFQNPKTGFFIASKNQDISPSLARKLNSFSLAPIKVRSPLTCQTSKHVCQLCYGWSLASGQLVDLGEAIGIIAAQSIGEPGTQLTMRTFHTGGVFSGEVIERFYAPHPGKLRYKSKGTIQKIRSVFGQEVFYFNKKAKVRVKEKKKNKTKLKFPKYTLFFIKEKESVHSKQIIAEYSSLKKILKKFKNRAGLITLKEVVSDIEGQVYFHFFTKQGKWTKKQSKNKFLKGNGLVWVLAGKILSSSFFNQPLKRKGDFINFEQLQSPSNSSSLSSVDESITSFSFFNSRVLSNGFLYKKNSLNNTHYRSLLWLPVITGKFYFPTEFGYPVEMINEFDYSHILSELQRNQPSFSLLVDKLSTKSKITKLKHSFSPARLYPLTRLDKNLQKRFKFTRGYLDNGYEIYDSMIYFRESFPAWFYWPKKRTFVGLKQMKKHFCKHYRISRPYQILTDGIQFNESIFSKWYPSFNMFRFQKIVSFSSNHSVYPSYRRQLHSSLFLDSDTPLIHSFEKELHSNKKDLNSKEIRVLPPFRDKKMNFDEFIHINENDQSLIKQKENQIRFQLNQQKPWVKPGSFVFKGDSLAPGIKSTHSGKVIQKTKMYITLQIGHPYRIPNSSPIIVSHGGLILQGKTLFNLLYKKAKTSDIVQGLPKVEEILEARRTKGLQPILNNPNDRLKEQFDKYKAEFDIKTASHLSFLYMRQFLVNSVQNIYKSQGVDISDKHIEIIVKQMTSKVVIDESTGQTPFLYGDLVDFEQLNKINDQLTIQGKELAVYEPVILGITKVSLKAESFLSAASFQETTRVLTQAAILGKLDSFLGLKENVIIGQLIPAGTGFLRKKLPVGFKSTLTLFPSYASRFLLDVSP